jgi:hypothetical protein
MLTIQLDGTLEERLKLAAASRGDEPTALARAVLDRNLPAAEVHNNAGNQMAAIESFIAGMTDWVSKHVPPGHFVDDDRESIYQRPSV